MRRGAKMASDAAPKLTLPCFCGSPLCKGECASRVVGHFGNYISKAANSPLRSDLHVI